MGAPRAQSTTTLPNLIPDLPGGLKQRRYSGGQGPGITGLNGGMAAKVSHARGPSARRVGRRLVGTGRGYLEGMVACRARGPRRAPGGSGIREAAAGVTVVMVR